MIDDRFLPRVWTDKGYYYPIFSELGITYENKNLPFTKENIKDINWAFRWRFNHSNENVDMEYINTLEQCTGLKDRNQKLIYEGDILDFDLSTPKNGGHYRGFIRWQEQNELIGWMISDMDMSGDWDLRQIAHPNDWMVWGEIIGNIHENADLLEVEE